MNSESWELLEERLRRLHVRPQDVTEQFVRSGGHGGQNVNKVATCVILTHKPSGISVRCEEERSQSLNRFLARKRLAERLEGAEKKRILEKQQAAEKTRRQKRGRNRAAKERMLRGKHHRAQVKKFRKVPRGEES